MARKLICLSLVTAVRHREHSATVVACRLKVDRLSPSESSSVICHSRDTRRAFTTVFRTTSFLRHVQDLDIDYIYYNIHAHLMYIILVYTLV